MITEVTDIKNVAGCVLFDAECLFCTRLATCIAPLLHRHGFELAPLQTPWVMKLLGRGRGNAWTEMLLLTPEGAIYGGADALLELTKWIWWVRPLYLFSHVPGVKPGLRKAYAMVAQRRLCRGGACRLQDATNRPGKHPHKTLVFFEMP